MRRLWTRVRAALGMGLTWATAWFAGGLVVALGIRLMALPRPDVPLPLVFGAFGFIGGVTFSGVLTLLEGRRSFAEMSVPRFAAWGGSAGFLLASALAATGGSSFLSSLAVLGPVLAAAGAGSAAGSLALARRADDPEALEAREAAVRALGPGDPREG